MDLAKKCQNSIFNTGILSFSVHSKCTRMLYSGCAGKTALLLSIGMDSNLISWGYHVNPDFPYWSHDKVKGNYP